MKVNNFSQSHTEVLQRNACILIRLIIRHNFVRNKLEPREDGLFESRSVSIIPKEIYYSGRNKNGSLDEVGPGISYIIVIF